MILRLHSAVLMLALTQCAPTYRLAPAVPYAQKLAEPAMVVPVARPEIYLPKIAPVAVPSFKIQGPYWTGSPVHEKLTFDSLRRAGYLKEEERQYKASNNSSYWEVVRGVVWNDDPDALLFGSNVNTSKRSHGVVWLSRFKAAEKAAEEAGDDDPPLFTDLTARTHFGDLQFLHAMAATKKERAGETKASLMRWLKFAYAVSSGTVATNTLLKDTEAAPLRLGSSESATVRDLFKVSGEEKADLPGYTSDSITRDRALGSMLHLIQDSHSRAHTERSEETNNAGYHRIKRFFCYIGQNKKQHSHDDEDPGSFEGDITGACASLIILSRQQKPWSEAKILLEAVFDVVDESAQPEEAASHQDSTEVHP